jgi:hypothetical protein
MSPLRQAARDESPLIVTDEMVEKDDRAELIVLHMFGETFASPGCANTAAVLNPLELKFQGLKPAITRSGSMYPP